jgi:hypothetical protein
MRLTINIDGLGHQIDSTDPELLGKWMLEIFARAATSGFTNATYITVQVWPTWIPDASAPQGTRPDWVADTRIVGGVWQVASPRELVAALAKQLDDAEMPE